MDKAPKIKYSIRGRLWARGWNRYEAATMNRLFGILIFMAVIGAVAGVLGGLWLELSLGLVILLMLSASIVALVIGIVIARAVIPFLWEVILTRDLEKEA